MKDLTIIIWLTLCLTIIVQSQPIDYPENDNRQPWNDEQEEMALLVRRMLPKPRISRRGLDEMKSLLGKLCVNVGSVQCHNRQIINARTDNEFLRNLEFSPGK